MLRISSLTPLLISILALFAAAQLDRRHQDKESFVTVPLTQDSNLTPTQRSTLATNMGKDAVNLERRWTEFLVNVSVLFDSLLIITLGIAYRIFHPY